MQRVKVYRLTADGQWDDKGTGKVSVEWMEVGADSPVFRTASAAILWSFCFC